MKTIRQTKILKTLKKGLEDYFGKSEVTLGQSFEIEGNYVKVFYTADFMKRDNGSDVFYVPEDEEQFSYDGGLAYDYISGDVRYYDVQTSDKFIEALSNAFNKVGLYIEEGASWYHGVYKD